MDPRPHSRSERVCHIHNAPCVSRQRSSMLANSKFSASLLNKKSIQDRLGLLNIHSAKASSPPANSLRNFSNHFSHSDFDKVSPKNESCPLAAHRQFLIRHRPSFPIYYRSSESIRPPEPLRISLASPPAHLTTVTGAIRLGQLYRNAKPC